MIYKKVLLATTLILSFSNAKVSFLDFSNICEKTETKSCPNNKKEIAIVQKLLNIGSKHKIKTTGTYDKATKEAIMAFQKANGLPDSGFVGMQTKIALEQKFRELKYKATHKESTTTKEPAKVVAKKESTKKPEKVTLKKDEKKEKIAKKDSKKAEKKIATKDKSKSSKKIALKDKKKNSKKTIAKKDIKKTTKVAKSKSKDSKKLAKNATKAKTFKEFRKYVNLRKSYRVFKNYSLLKKANSKNTTVKISVKDQRVNLLVNGKVALCAPCTTGSKHKLEPNTRTYRDKRTPYGTFKIMEKIATKRSTIFGSIYRNGKVVYKGDRRKYKGPKGKFVGHPLKNWMRLTSSGIGLHASKYVKRYPGSNGCVRLPKDVSKIIFSKVSRGTKVIVSN